MALQGPYTSEDGVLHPDAYLMVGDISIDWLGHKAQTACCIFHDQATRNAGNAPIAIPEYTFRDTESDTIFSDNFSSFALDPAGVNPAKQVYDIVKNYPEYAGWVSV